MNRIILILIVVSMLIVPVSAMEFEAPEAPESVQKIIPEDPENFGDGLRYVIVSGLNTIQPSIVEALRVCISLIAVSILTGLLSEFSGNVRSVIQMAGTASTGLILFQPVNALLYLGTDTVEQISDYGRLLLPVMTGALAAEGGISKSGALYTATAFFDAILTSAISELLIPVVYVFMCTAIGCNLFAEPFLKEIKNFLSRVFIHKLKVYYNGFSVL